MNRFENNRPYGSPVKVCAFVGIVVLVVSWALNFVLLSRTKIDNDRQFDIEFSYLTSKTNPPNSAWNVAIALPVVDQNVRSMTNFIIQGLTRSFFKANGQNGYITCSNIRSWAINQIFLPNRMLIYHVLNQHHNQTEITSKMDQSFINDILVSFFQFVTNKIHQNVNIWRVIQPKLVCSRSDCDLIVEWKPNKDIMWNLMSF